MVLSWGKRAVNVYQFLSVEAQLPESHVRYFYSGEGIPKQVEGCFPGPLPIAGEISPSVLKGRLGGNSQHAPQ